MPDARSQRQYIQRHIDAEVEFWSDDIIRLRCRDGRRYTMRLGTDDDVYRFTNDADPADVVTFPVQDEE